MTLVREYLPLKLESANAILAMHLRQRLRYKAEHKALTRMVLSRHRPDLQSAFAKGGGLEVRIVRIGPRPLADDDNLSGGAKWIRDMIAEVVGVDDGDKRYVWVYEQRRGVKRPYGVPAEYAVEIIISERAPSEVHAAPG